MGMLNGQLDRLLYSGPGQWISAAVAGLAAVLAPVSCVVCGAPDRSLCGICAAGIRRGTLHPYFAQEGAGALPAAEPEQETEVPDVPARDEPSADPFVPLPVLAAGAYKGGLAQTLLAFKNRGHTDLAGFLCPVLGGVLHAAVADARLRSGAQPLVLVPVPGTGASRRKRGYVPLALLLKRLRRRRLLPPGCRVASLVAPASGHGMAGMLPRLPDKGHRPGGKVPSGPQKGLGRSARRRNIRGTMTAGPPGTLAGVNCLVLDDVLTTGATIAETARALRRAGAKVFGAAVIAATPAPGRNTGPTFAAVPGVAPGGGGNGIAGRE